MNEDHFIVEVVNPATLEPVKPGDEGELVFTTITKEGFPVIRYRTRDLARLIPGACACGRTTVRMSRIAGRTDDMIIVLGAKVFPSQIQEALLAILGAIPEYRIVLDRKDDIDEMELLVALSETAGFDEMRTLERLRKEIVSRIQTDFDIEPKVTFVEAGSLRRKEGSKDNPVIDNRK